VCKGALLGILSLSANCGTQNKLSIYTDVAQNAAWISQTITTLNGAAAPNSMSYVTIAAMLAALSSFWNCRT